MNYSFIQAGTSIASVDNDILYLDVGNKLCDGIIDHHQLNGIQKSATRLVYENPDFIPKKLNKITLHSSPDLDCIASSYLAEYYFINNTFPSFANELCDFVDKADFGLDLGNIVNLSSIFSIIKNDSKSDDEIVKNGHKLIDNFHALEIYQKESSEILDDVNIFNQDLQSSSTQIFTLEDRYTKQKIQTTGLILKQPKSKLFKYWARDKGYDLFIVQWSEKRTVISLKGDSFLTLEGIGNRLNQLEKAKRLDKHIKIDEPNREGYDMPDPWYDGRGHGFTIVDSPRIGTVLSFEQILALINSI